MALKNNHGAMRLSAIALGLIVASCDVVEPGPVDGGSGVEVRGAAWTEEAGGLAFTTNADADRGYMFFNTYAAVGPADSIEGTVQRLGGSSTRGAGIVWGYRDPDNYYCVLVDATGYYHVFKIVAGYYTKISDWAYSAALGHGDAVNTVTVVRSYYLGDYRYSVSLNGASVGAFRADANLEGVGSSVGFVVGVGDASDEDFPAVPVKVRFRLFLPVAVP